jgi:hypothetical protein
MDRPENVYEVPQGLPEPEVERGEIEHVFYPVFPPGRNAEEIVCWLSERTAN